MCITVRAALQRTAQRERRRASRRASEPHSSRLHPAASNNLRRELRQWQILETPPAADRRLCISPPGAVADDLPRLRSGSAAAQPLAYDRSVAECPAELPPS